MSGVRWGVFAAVVAFFVYLPSAVTNGFVAFDDPGFITGVPEVEDGISIDTLWWALTSVSEINYIPVTRVSYLLDASLFGVERAAGHHVVSAVLHGVNTFLLALLFAWGLRRVRGEFPVWLPAGLALIWALHPVGAEAVAWATSRKHVLAFGFGVGAVLCYLRPGRAWYLGALGCFILSLGAKGNFASLPLWLLLVDGFSGRRGWLRSFLGLVPFLSVALGLAVVSRHAAMVPESTVPLLTVMDSIAEVPSDLLVMLGRVVVPVGLAFHYPVRLEAPWGEFLIVGCGFAFVGFVVWRLWRRFPWVALGVGWFVVLWIPVSGVIPFGNQGGADRFLYAALPGLIFACGAALRRGALPWICGLVLVLGLLTLRQAATWKDSETLFTHAVRGGGAESPVAAFSAFAGICAAGAAEGGGQGADGGTRFRPQIPSSPAQLGSGGDWGRAVWRCRGARAGGGVGIT